MKHLIFTLAVLLHLLPNSILAQHQQHAPQQGRKLNIQAIDKAVGIKGTEKDGEYKITVPQNDLDVTVDGFKIIPPMGLGSWAAFTPTADGAMLMGDIVVRENEIGPVQQVLVQNGLAMTALHKHFAREEPRVMYMHIGGMGSEEKLAQGVKAVLDKVAALRKGDPSKASAQSVQNTLDKQQIASILGQAGGEDSRGVYKVTIGRPDVKLQDHGAPVSTFMGFNTWAAWQGTPQKAAVAGDFTMLESEVAPLSRPWRKTESRWWPCTTTWCTRSPGSSSSTIGAWARPRSWPGGSRRPSTRPGRTRPGRNREPNRLFSTTSGTLHLDGNCRSTKKRGCLTFEAASFYAHKNRFSSVASPEIRRDNRSLL
jgi:hypothetical protein